MYIYVCVYVCMYMYVCMYVCMCVYVCMYVRMYVHGVCMYMYIHTRIYIYTYIHIYIYIAQHTISRCKCRQRLLEHWRQRSGRDLLEDECAAGLAYRIREPGCWGM